MIRKKLSDMTPIERVDQRMKGMSWEEAEDVGVEILARCLSLHVHDAHIQDAADNLSRGVTLCCAPPFFTDNF